MTGRRIGERVRDLRTLLGLTQQQLGEMVKINQATISRIERLLVPVEDDLVEAIADATDMPMAFLLADPIGIDEGSLRFRKKATARRSETMRVVQGFIEAYRVCAALAEKQRAAPPDVSTVEHSRELKPADIERLAEDARAQLGVDRGQPVAHVTRIMERAGLFVVPIGLPGEDDADQLLGHTGASTWRAPWEPPVLGCVTTVPGDRLRFTIAHEFGHVLLHTHRAEWSTKTMEAEANQFAAAFLFPRSSAREAFALMSSVTLSRLKALKAGWGMSIQALIYRARTLGYIDKSRHASLMRQLTARGWRTDEPVTVRIEQPLLLRTRLAAQYGGDVIDWDEAGEDLGLRPAMLRSLAPGSGGVRKPTSVS